MIGTLMWKDVKLNRVPIAFAAVLFLAPLAIVVANTLLDPRERGGIGGGRMDAVGIGVSLFAGAVASVLVVPAYAAVAFARERRDRSGEFLQMFPIARWKVVLSKLVVSVVLAAMPWVLFSPFILVWTSNDDLNGALIHNLTTTAPWVGLGGLCMFGLAWLLSCFVRSETIAAGVALVFTLVLVIGVLSWIDGMNDSSTVRDQLAQRVLCTILPTIGGGCLIAGTVIALRRKSP